MLPGLNLTQSQSTTTPRTAVCDAQDDEDADSRIIIAKVRERVLRSDSLLDPNASASVCGAARQRLAIARTTVHRSIPADSLAITCTPPIA